MSVKVERQNRAAVISVAGDLSADAAAQARRLSHDALEQQKLVDVVVDLEHCPFVDSEGLEALLWIKRECEAHGGQVRLVAADENCRAILHVTRLEHRFECHPSLEAALKSMG